jgi:hypothetical protein
MAGPTTFNKFTGSRGRSFKPSHPEHKKAKTRSAFLPVVSFSFRDTKNTASPQPPLDFSLEESTQGRFQRQVKSPYSTDAAFNRAKGVRRPGESNRALLAFVLVIML